MSSGAEMSFDRLQINCQFCPDPYTLFVNGYIVLKGDSKFCNCFLEQFPHHPVAINDSCMKNNEITKEQRELIQNALDSIDHGFQLKFECFEYVLNNWDELDCEYINQINVGHALKMVQNLEHFNESSLSTCEWLRRKSPEKRPIVLEICQQIFFRLKLFYDQLLFMMNRSHNNHSLTERMFQDLFMAFLRIFDLKIYDTTKTEHNSTLGEIVSEPDALICKFTEAESTVAAFIESSTFAVADIHKYCKKRVHDSMSASSIVIPIAAHIDESLKDQQIREMIAVTPSSSAFGKRGVFGFIVQGTKVTLTSLEINSDFLENTNVNSGGVVKYSKECNILVKRGRHELIPILLTMATLFQND